MSIKTEEGYTLMGLLVALAIMSMVTSGIMSVIFQINNVSSARTNQIVAVREVQNAGHWLTRDVQMAATVQPTQDADGFPLSISWNDADDNQHQVVYTLLPDNKLQREHYTNRSVNPAPDITTIVAKFVDLSDTSCSYSGNNELIVEITVSVNLDGKIHTEARTYRAFVRQSMH